MPTATTIKWFEKPEQIRIKLEPQHVKPMPLGHDTFIVMKIGGRQYDALIPSSTLEGGNKYAPASLVGKNGDKMILYFPVSNEGRPTWELSEEELASIRA
jgi:hypothetical protein